MSNDKNKIGVNLNMNVQEMIFQFIGGLGIFLFGVKYMGDGLRAAAWDRFREILDKLTTNPLMGILTGILVSSLIQTSAGTTALTVALVSAGFMTLRQAIGVIMGANIGTTITSFGIDIGVYGLPIIAVSAMIIFFIKNPKITSIGQVAFGCGALFFGLQLMRDGMRPIRSLEAFQELTISLSNEPLLGVVMGTFFTILIQSSSATVAILQELFSQGSLALYEALPILFGDNIGTTITAVIASIGASISAKRAAGAHVLINIIGAIIFLMVLEPFTVLISYLQDALNLNPAMTIAFAHGTFNVMSIIIFLPFIGGLIWLVTKMIPGEDDYIDFKPQHLNLLYIEHSPTIALGQAKEEMKRMTEFSVKGMNEVYSYLHSSDTKYAENALHYEVGMNHLDRSITNYLVEISSKPLSIKDKELLSDITEWVRSIEQIGDHMENILELVNYKINKKTTLSEETIIDVTNMFTFTIQTLETTYNAIFDHNLDLARTVLENKNKIDQMERVLRKKQIQFLNEGNRSGDEVTIFLDMISNLKSIGEHAANTAETLIYSVIDLKRRDSEDTVMLFS